MRGIVRNKWREYCRRQSREIPLDEETLSRLEQPFEQSPGDDGGGGEDDVENREGRLRVPLAHGGGVAEKIHDDRPGVGGAEAGLHGDGGHEDHHQAVLERCGDELLSPAARQAGTSGCPTAPRGIGS